MTHAELTELVATLERQLDEARAEVESWRRQALDGGARCERLRDALRDAEDRAERYHDRLIRAGVA